MDRSDWNARYEASTVWSGEPNAALVAHAPRPPRPWAAALDLGCGEGADALWLAEQGWQVTGVDWSGVALGRARAAAGAAGLAARFVEADITDLAALAALSPTGTFDLVTVAFLHPEPADRARFYAPLPALLAPGGHLLVVTHDPEHGARGLPGPPPHRLLSADDVLAALALPTDVEVVVRTTEPRLVPGEAGGAPQVRGLDAVVLVRRTAAG
jgi:SAM-dependent methyltransferase